MRLALALLLLSTTAASAHPGHWGELAGHDHWIAAGALGAAAAAALWGWLKGKKDDEEATEDDPELEEETA
ncbi:DUF6732 family protein [Nereida sp. MMG025]|uniref:DUF6732 family protein n=1 Tax=Nereida sp. MMG025 TaxID=2909981 RepID=UPI001F2035AC|nr:DUF6732 family protein [Nereida sp. MMG025]MCF6444912.1 hypothetical protein [Nereida sp. MMG025]